MDDLLLLAAERASRYRDALGERRVAPLPEAVARLSALDGPLPEGSTDPVTVLTLLDEIGSPATVTTAGGRYFGFVFGSSLPVTLAANWLAGAWDQNAFGPITSPVGASVEEIALRWRRAPLWATSPPWPPRDMQSWSRWAGTWKVKVCLEPRR